MKAATALRDRLAQGLLALGAEEIFTQTQKYRVFRRGINELYYFVGPAGALRFNRYRPLVSSSIPVSANMKRRILDAAAGQTSLLEVANG